MYDDVYQWLDNSKKKYGEESLETKKTEECAICLEEFKADDEVDTLNCHQAHVFHHDCIKSWVASQQDKLEEMTCPSCRGIVQPEN